MKKFILIVWCVCFSFLLVGCSGETKIMSAHLSDSTGALSTKYAVKLVLDKDDRVNDKYVDVQVRSSKDEQILNFGVEAGDQYSIYLPKKDFWYNLTYLISKTNGTSVEAGYQKYEDYGNKIFNFCADNDVDLTFRVVAGQVKVNEKTQEEILVLSEGISKELKIEVKKCEEK
ncbi:MAG: hypothetical protein E7375_01050 [Clostridiales bacterium]|nr:hypothetical protein [Clostridiales bacterium]